MEITDQTGLEWIRQVVAAVALVAAALLAGCGGAPPPGQVDTPPPAARTVEARVFRVVRVIDGDTFTVIDDESETSVRPPRIDAPERGTPGAAAATAALVELIGDRRVRLEFSDADGRKRDHFGRLLCTVYVIGADGAEVDVEAELLRRGLVAPYRRR